VVTQRVSSHTGVIHGIERWTDLGSSTFAPLACRTSTDTFRGALTSTAVGNVQLTRVRASAHEVLRTPKLIARSDPEMFKLGLQVRGTGRLVQDGKYATLAPNDLALYDTARPYSLAMSGAATETVVLMFTPDAIGLTMSQMSKLSGVHLPAGEALVGMISPFLTRLTASVSDFDDIVTGRLLHTVMDLMETMVRQRLDLGFGQSETIHRSRLFAIQSWIEAHLDEPDLSPATVAAAHGMSIRYLYRLFEAEGSSVARWIKERRLERCRRDLANPALSHIAVRAITARHGLFDPAGFSRAFRTAYGESPRAFRSRQRELLR
jgi:AraC-like DNA-binding protein